MFGAELKDQSIRLLFDGGDDELDDVAGLVLEFNRQVFTTENRSCVLKRFQEFFRRDAMIEILADPGLKKTSNETAHGAAAIDEVLLDATDLGDVEMWLNRLSVSPEYGERQGRCSSKRGLERRNGNAL